MNDVFLYEDEYKADLYPFAELRHIADIRVGILTIREKWQQLGARVITETANSSGKSVPANIVPTEKVWKQLNEASNVPDWNDGTFHLIKYPWQIFQFNDWAIREDFALVTKGRTSAEVPSTVQVISPENIFIEEGARLSYCTLNASTGPIYIEKNAEIMEGALIRGPFALCEGAVVKMGAKIYGATTIGPYCAVAGEIKNTVFFGYSNKGHDGYLGDSVIGEWCNLGAGTTNSNLKNNLGDIRIWSQTMNDYVTAGQRIGLLMGDYSRSAINTSFNSGTVVGISANVISEGLSQKYYPDFTWSNSRYEFEKALKDIDAWKKLKNHSLSENEIRQLHKIYHQL